MTIQEYHNLKVGEKFRIKETGRVVTLGTIETSPWFKYESRFGFGFMVGNIWYRYQDCEIVKQ